MLINSRDFCHTIDKLKPFLRVCYFNWNQVLVFCQDQ